MLGMWGIGLAGVVGWSVLAQPTWPRILLAIAVAALTGAVAGRAWFRTTAGMLSWDGEGWSWAERTHTEIGAPEVALDAQRILLLRWVAAKRVRWFWLERTVLPARWDDLRRAVYSRAP